MTTKTKTLYKETLNNSIDKWNSKKSSSNPQRGRKRKTNANSKNKQKKHKMADLGLNIYNHIACKWSKYTS